MNEQAILPLATPEDEAFEDGRLTIIMTEHLHYHRGFSGHVRSGEFIRWEGDKFATVHVVSKPAGGEIRGYVRLGGVLFLRTPAYPPSWDDLDLAVSKRLGMPVCNREVAPSASSPSEERS